MTKVNPYIFVKNGKDAIELYKEVLGAKLVEHLPFSKESGKKFGFSDDFDYDNSTMHAVLDIGGANIMICDNVLGLSSSGNVDILIQAESKKQIDDIYNKAKEKGFKIKMELKKRMWGSWFARFEDSEGIGWQLNYEEEQKS